MGKRFVKLVFFHPESRLREFVVEISVGESFGFVSFHNIISPKCSPRRFHYFHRGQTTTGCLSPNTNTEEGTLTQESGDVRSVEGEVCGAVLVDECWP